MSGPIITPTLKHIGKSRNARGRNLTPHVSRFLFSFLARIVANYLLSEITSETIVLRTPMLPFKAPAQNRKKKAA